MTVTLPEERRRRTVLRRIWLKQQADAGMLSSTAVRKAAKPLGDRAVALSQPVVVGTGSDRKFSNPWAGFEVSFVTDQ